MDILGIINAALFGLYGFLIGKGYHNTALALAACTALIFHAIRG